MLQIGFAKPGRVKTFRKSSFFNANMVLENMISEAIEGLFGYFLDHFGYNVGTQNAFSHELVKKSPRGRLQCDYNDFLGYFKLAL